MALDGCRTPPPRQSTVTNFLGADHGPGDPLWAAEAAAFVARFPAVRMPAANAAYTPDQLAGTELGVVVLSAACPFDHTTVGFCGGQYRCPVCGSTFDGVGERLAGPAQRGLDRFAFSKTKRGELLIDVDRRIAGPNVGVRTADGSPDPTCTPLRLPPIRVTGRST